MIKEAMECEVTEVHTDTVARLKDTLLSQEQFQNLGTLFKICLLYTSCSSFFVTVPYVL